MNNDKEIDFIKVITKKEGEDFIFILQIVINKNEIQDIAVINVDKNKDGNVSVQIIGDETLYGKDYIVEPASDKATKNPAHSVNQTVIVNEVTVNQVPVNVWPVVSYVCLLYTSRCV